MMYTSATQVESSSLQVKADAKGMEQTESQVSILNSQTMATARETSNTCLDMIGSNYKNILCQCIKYSLVFVCPLCRGECLKSVLLSVLSLVQPAAYALHVQRRRICSKLKQMRNKLKHRLVEQGKLLSMYDFLTNLTMCWPRSSLQTTEYAYIYYVVVNGDIILSNQFHNANNATIIH